MLKICKKYNVYNNTSLRINELVEPSMSAARQVRRRTRRTSAGSQARSSPPAAPAAARTWACPSWKEIKTDLELRELLQQGVQYVA